jgi:hypothetical protein
MTRPWRLRRPRTMHTRGPVRTDQEPLSALSLERDRQGEREGERWAVRSGTSPTRVAFGSLGLRHRRAIHRPRTSRGSSAHEITANPMLPLSDRHRLHPCRCSTAGRPAGIAPAHGCSSDKAPSSCSVHRALLWLALVRAVGAQGQCVPQRERPGVDHPGPTQPHVRIDLGCGDPAVDGA